MAEHKIRYKNGDTQVVGAEQYKLHEGYVSFYDGKGIVLTIPADTFVSIQRSDVAERGRSESRASGVT